MSAREDRLPASCGIQPPTVRAAERIIHREKRRIRGEEAVRRRARPRAPASPRLLPERPIIHVVTVDGRARSGPGRWSAVRCGRALAEAATFAEAVYMLAERESEPQ
ncbi:hypothetical protein GCM10022222_59460 [Amycolatopsis ultiminotia]|uniref:Uncharacterized protein n=1 Tax=Amycolatopsis ultiminotia TaxID=543629 RepID=A0ABP6XIG0_9PSEU